MRKIFSWMLYDWASSAVPTLHTTFVFSVYFTTLVMPENGTVAWSFMVAISALITAIMAPVLGHLADRNGRLIPPLFMTTLIAGGAVMGLWFVLPDPAYALLGLGLSALIIITTEIGFVYYNGLLPHLARTTDLGRLSSFGWGLGYIGAMIALVLVLCIFILPDPPYFGLDKAQGEPVRAVMLFTGFWFVVFALPVMIFSPDIPHRTKTGRFRDSMMDPIKTIWSTPFMFRFLLARMAYSDGLITLFAFGGIYAAKVFAFQPKEILLFAISLNISAGIGAIFSTPIYTRWGSLWVIKLSLICLFILGWICVLTSVPAIFWTASIILGLFIGPCQAAGRVWIAEHAPKTEVTGLFGFLALSGKLTSFVGPLFYGWLVYATDSERSGMLVVLALFLLGYLLLPPTQTKQS